MEHTLKLLLHKPDVIMWLLHVDWGGIKNFQLLFIHILCEWYNDNRLIENEMGWVYVTIQFYNSLKKKILYGLCLCLSYIHNIIITKLKITQSPAICEYAGNVSHYIYVQRSRVGTFTLMLSKWEFHSYVR